jgi:hypothetical protein
MEPMAEGTVKTLIKLPKRTDKMLKMLELELDLKTKSEAVEFLIEALMGELRPEIEAKFAKALAPGHAAISKRRSKSVKEMNREMDSW